MVAQGVCFSIEVAIVHHLGNALSLPVFGVIRGIGCVLLAMVFARSFNVFKTKQLPLQLLRGLTVLVYGWVLVLSFGQLPIADAVAISYTQIVYVAIMSVVILGETVPSRRWLAVLAAVGGAMLLAKPSFSGIGLIYLIAIFGTSLNALNFVLNRKSNRVDAPTTTMAWANGVGALGNLPLLLLFPPQIDPGSWIIPWLASFLFIGPLGVYAGVYAAKLAESSFLAPYQVVRLVLGVLAGCLVFFEWPDLWVWAGIVLIALSWWLNLEPGKMSRRENRLTDTDRDAMLVGVGHPGSATKLPGPT